MKRLISLLCATWLLALAVISGSAARVAAPPVNDLLQFLPDASGVALVDVQKCIASPVWAVISSQDKIRRELEHLEGDASELGIRLEDLQALAITFNKMDFGSPTVAVSGGFDQNTILAKLRANPKYKVTSEKYKDVEITSVENVTPPASQPTDASKSSDVKINKQVVRFLFYDSSTAVIGSLDSLHGSVDAKLGTRPNIGQNAQLATALGENAGAPIRFAMSVTPDISGKLQSSELPLPDLSSIRLIWASIDLSSGVNLIATLRNDSAEHAKAIVDRLNNLLMMVRGFLGASNDPKMSGLVETINSVTVTGADTDVKITGNVTLDALKTFLGGASAAPARKP